MAKVFYTILVFLIILMAFYALGLIKGNDLTKVKNKEYAENTLMYTGNLKNGGFDGECEITFKDGSTYKGDISGGEFDGTGIFTSAEGWYCNGTFSQGSMTSGTIYYDNGKTVTFKEDAASLASTEGWTYNGAFGKQGQYSSGTFIFTDGSTYKGDFLSGLADGNGVYTGKDGTKIYEGEFKAGLFDGNGTYYNADGWKYTGEFKAGAFNGNGSLVQNGKTVTGIWTDGKLVKQND